jgi:subtilisin family serine protease
VRIRALVLATLVAFVLCFPPASSAAFDSRVGAIIVKLRDSGDPARPPGAIARATASAIDEVGRRFGVVRVDTLFPSASGKAPPASLAHVLRVVVPDGVGPTDLEAAYAAVDGVEYVEPDYLLSLFEVPDDPYFAEQWALRNTGQSHYHVLRIPGANNDSLTISQGLPGADIQAAAVLEHPPDAASTAVVAILDTGVDIDHPDLAGRLWINPGEIAGNAHDDDHNGFVDDVYGWDCSGDMLVVSSNIKGDRDPSDRHGHGTHCAGIVGAVTGNGLGIAGVASPCRIMAVKMFPAAFISVAARALVYAADNGADVINMSWGGPWYSRTLKEALDYARARGVVLVAASGNDGTDVPLYPAAYPGVIAVSATDDHDRVTDFSTIGLHIDLAAPGQSILSLRADYTDMYAENYEPYVHVIHQIYYLASGTSMAAPHVAAAAAWLEAVSPGLSPGRAEEILKQSADDLVDPYGRGDFMPGWDPYSGTGRLNLERALSASPAGRAQIITPAAHQILSGLAAVAGTAKGEPGENFVLDCGRGSLPDQWTRLAAGPATVAGATLATWNTDTLIGLFTLRLRVGQSHEDQVKVYAANARRSIFQSPAEGDTVVSVARVRAAVSSPTFDSYLLEYADWPESKSWHRIDSVTQPVVDDLVGTWYTGNLPDGWYRLRLTLFDDGPPLSDTIRVLVRSPLSAGRGWKVPLGTDEPALLANWGDFDRDGSRELVIGTEHGVQFFRPDGTAMASPLSAPTSGRPAHTPVAVGDLDGDGCDDLMVIDDDGNLMGFPSTEQPFVVPSPYPLVVSFEWLEEHGFPLLFLRDVDGDNRDEIHYFPGWSRAFLASYFVLTPDGGLLTEIPRLSGLPNRAFGAYLPADLDGNGHDELYVADTRLNLITAQGTVDASVPLSTGPVAYTAVNLSAADVDGDGTLELIVLAAPSADAAGLCPGTYHLFAFDENLALRPGWPHDTKIDCVYDTSLPVFGDMDGDGVQEYFITSFNWDAGLVSAWHLDGTPFLGGAGAAVFATTFDAARLRAPVLADLDGDNLQELVACATTGFPNGYPYDRLYAWDHQGRVLPGWPVVIEDSVGAGDQRRYALSAGDVDGDGRIDLTTVTSNNRLVLLNVGAPGGTFSRAEVPFWRYDRGLSNVAPIAGDLNVIAVQPTKRQERVDAESAWRVTFNRDLDPSAVTDGVVHVRGSASGERQGNVVYDQAERTLSWAPLEPFSLNDTVYVTLSSDLRTPDGHALAHGFASSYMIGAEVPAIVSLLPLPNAVSVTPNADLTARFNTRLDPTSIDTASLAVTGSFTGIHQGIVRYDSLTRSIVFDPDLDFIVGEFVQATVSKRIRSVWGFHVTRDSTWSFLVAYASVSAVTPAPLAIGAPPGGGLTARTTHHVDASVINDSTFVAWGSQSGRMPAALHCDDAVQEASLSPLRAFFPGEEVTATFAPAHYSWQFGVAPKPGPAHFGAAARYPIA